MQHLHHIIIRRSAPMPAWQAIPSHLIFILCAASGVLYLLAHEFEIAPLAIKNHSLLIAHGVSAYLFVILFGSVMPVHIKSGWKTKRNRISGGLMIAVMTLLLVSGLILYYGVDTREPALWVHWVIGCGLVVLFPAHYLLGKFTSGHSRSHTRNHSTHKQH